jgi:hypothetical protein
LELPERAEVDWVPLAAVLLLDELLWTMVAL